MAQRIITELIDDIDGSPAAHSIRFAIDGAQYEIDLNDANASSLRQAFAAYVASGRRVGGRAKRSKSKAKANDVRNWAEQNGFEVTTRGRLPRGVQQAYDEAHA